MRAHFFDPSRIDAHWETALERTRGVVVSEPSRAVRVEALGELLGELGTSHTAYFTDEDPSWYVLLELFWDAFEPERRAQLFPRGQPSWPGIGILPERVELDGERAWFARVVLAGGPAAAAGVLPGDRLLAVEGAPYRPVISFRGRAGKPTHLRLQRTSDPASVREVVLVPEGGSPRAFFQRDLEAGARVEVRDGQRFALARMVSWAGEELQAKLAEVLLEGALTGADGLVLDLRGGYGGANPEYLELFRRDLPALAFGDREGRRTDLSSSWTKPTVLLIDEGTTSGKEVFAHGFRRQARGPLVGARTAGAVLGGRAFLLQDGSLLYLAVLDLLVDGERLEGRGVEPDVAVELERPYAAGRDPQLERALEALSAEIAAGR